MKSTCSAIALFLIVFLHEVPAQSFYYPLQSNLLEAAGNAGPLIEVPNELGQDGDFQVIPMPPNACSGVGALLGYVYPDNAGLRFNFPPATFGCEYTIQWLWVFDEAVPNSFIRVLSFIHTDDSGFYLQANLFGTTAFLIQWQLQTLIPGIFCPPVVSNLNGLVLEPDNLYQMTITRLCNGTTSVYANGVLLGSFTDTNLKYLAQASDPKIVLFRDTVSTLTCYPPFPGEASPGFIAELVINDVARPSTDIAADWANLCPLLLEAVWQEAEKKEPEPLLPPASPVFFPNPSSGVVRYFLPEDMQGGTFRVMLGNGSVSKVLKINELEGELDLSDFPAGLVFLLATGPGGQHFHQTILLTPLP